MSLPPSFITPNPPLTRQVLPRKSVVESNKEKHHHEEEAPKTTAQRIAALGTGVLLTTAVNLLVQAENKLPTASQPKPSALLSTDVSSWVKSLGLLAGVQGINTGLGLQFPPIINALELGAVSHMLIPGTLGGKVAHFMTMAPLLIGSVGATQLAHGVIDYTVEQDGGLNSKEKKLTKSLLGFMVSIGVGVGAMALFPRIHIGLAGLGVKFQSKTATGAKASENWYITTVKTVDGWQFATGKAWEHVQAKLKNQWERTLKKGDEKPVANTQAWFDKKTFKTHAEVPWTDLKFYTEQPEKKLYTLQKSHSQTLEVLPEPYTWQEHTMQWLTGKQSSVARAMLATKWGRNGKPVPSRQFLKGGEFEQFQAKYKKDIDHNMIGGVLPILKSASEIKVFLDGNPTVTLFKEPDLNHAVVSLIETITDPKNNFAKQDLSTDFTLIQERLLPKLKAIETIALRYPEKSISGGGGKGSSQLLGVGEIHAAAATVQEAATTQKKEHRLKHVMEAHLQTQKINTAIVINKTRQLLIVLEELDHIEGAIPSVSSFWAMTGAAAGAVTCGSGCCAGSFFCLNEATALFGSLFGALVGKLGLKQPQETNEKKKQKAKV
ncbi:MAG: hypothetical protein NTW61_08655 [Candidatus Melainabacteria bacterium]|nr:hypothetical protein [Candidatus Melainabacteria bacterium]